MAWARLVRTLARSAAILGVTDPLATQAVPSPRPTPRTRANWYSRHALKSMSSAPSWSRTSRAGCWARSVAAISSARFRACCGGTGHWPSLLVLSAPSATAPLMASWSPVSRQLVGADGHGEPEVGGDEARVGLGRGPLGHRIGGEPDLGPQIGVGQPVPVGDRVPEGDGAGRQPGRRRRLWRVAAGGQDDAHRRPGTARRRRPRPGTRGSGAPRHPRFAAFPSTDLTSRCRRQRRCDLTGCAQPGGSSTRQPLWPPKPKELESTAEGSQARGSPWTTWIVISGSGSA